MIIIAKKMEGGVKEMYWSANYSCNAFKPKVIFSSNFLLSKMINGVWE